MDIQVSETCYQSYPCQHDVVVDGKRERLYGIDIYKLYESKNLPVPKHFKEYNPKTFKLPGW